MDKKFVFKYMGGNDGEYDSKEYPTYEEALEAIKELGYEGFECSPIEEIRI